MKSNELSKVEVFDREEELLFEHKLTEDPEIKTILCLLLKIII